MYLKKKILIIGCGKIGLNHLDALKNFRNRFQIYLYDKRKINQKLLENKDIVFLKNLKQGLNFDIVIISTDSKERFNIFLKLVNFNKVKKIIFEKFIFYKNSQFSKTHQILKDKKIKAWVNCLRREIKIYDRIKKQKFSNIKIEYSASNWGLACNSIHFLDIFSYLNNDKKINQYSYILDKRLYKSKRHGYHEFKGYLQFKINKSILKLKDDISLKKKTFKISTPKFTYSFNKFENIITEKNLINNSIKKYKSENPYVSKITVRIIKKILANKKINLTSFENTMLHHKILIDIFSKHLKSIDRNKKLRIT